MQGRSFWENGGVQGLGHAESSISKIAGSEAFAAGLEPDPACKAYPRRCIAESPKGPKPRWCVVVGSGKATMPNSLRHAWSVYFGKIVSVHHGA